MKKIMFLISLLCINTFLYTKNKNITSINDLEKNSQKTDAKAAIKKFPDLAHYLKKSISEELERLLAHIANSDKIVIVKFYADWCQPCRRMMSIVKNVAQKFAHSIEFVEINIDYHPAIEKAFGVRYIPTFVFFKNGKEIERAHSLSESQLMSKIEHILK